MWTLVIFCACFCNVYGYVQIQMNEFTDNGGDGRSCGAAPPLSVRQPFKIFLRHPGDIYQPRCYLYKNKDLYSKEEVFTNFTRLSSRVGHVSGPIIPTAEGEWMYSCEFNQHRCNQIQNDVCYTAGGIENPVVCNVEVHVHREPLNGGIPPQQGGPATNDGRDPPPGRGSPTNDGRNSPPAQRPPTNDGGNQPPVSGPPTNDGRDPTPGRGSPTNDGRNSPPAQRPPTNDGGNQPPVSGPPTNDGRNPPPRRGSPTNDGKNPPPAQRPPTNDGGNQPPVSGPSTNDGRNPPSGRGFPTNDGRNPSPAQRPPTNDGGNQPPVSGPPTNDGRNPPPGRGSPTNDGRNPPAAQRPPTNDGSKTGEQPSSTPPLTAREPGLTGQQTFKQNTDANVAPDPDEFDWRWRVVVGGIVVTVAIAVAIWAARHMWKRRKMLQHTPAQSDYVNVFEDSGSASPHCDTHSSPHTFTQRGRNHLDTSQPTYSNSNLTYSDSQVTSPKARVILDDTKDYATTTLPKASETSLKYNNDTKDTTYANCRELNELLHKNKTVKHVHNNQDSDDAVAGELNYANIESVGTSKRTLRYVPKSPYVEPGELTYANALQLQSKRVN